ncbi:MAG: hypothetical protein HPY74_06010 [Firmicutes bacterium]|nr:hypothetical protein [Bacillota bacterium]
MGEAYVRCNSNELRYVTVTLPCCGIGLRIDLSQPLINQFKWQACTCGQIIPPAIKDIILQYKKAYDAINSGNYDVSFEIKVEK